MLDICICSFKHFYLFLALSLNVTWIMLSYARKHSSSSSGGCSLRCVNQSCIAVSGCVGIFRGSVSIFSLVLCEMKELGEIDSSAFFSVFHCLISILSPAVRKTNYVFNPLLHPPPILFRSSHLEIIMSLWQTTLALEKGRKKIQKVYLPLLKQAAGNYGQPFDPQKLSPPILQGLTKT